MTEPSKEPISWEEFQIRKNRSRKEILEAIASRIMFGHPSTHSLDLDLVPILNSWDDLPFSFTIYPSCSGTPKEHGDDHYPHVNHCKENPSAILMAHSYMPHPLFRSFNDFLGNYLNGKAVLKRSSEHGEKGYEGVYLHVIDIWVPEEVKQRGNLEYLDRFWEDFRKELDGFVLQYRGIDRLWRFGEE